MQIALLGAGFSLPARASEPDEWDREATADVFYVSPTNLDGITTHVMIRVVDHATGDPLPGASAALFAQDDHPITGLVPPVRMGFADEDGWIRIRADDLGWTPTWQMGIWKYVEAPGHAGIALRPGDDDGEWRLSRPRAAIIEVRDVLDHPVAGATLGARDSKTCGHMPDQRVVLTGFDGRAVVPGVAPSEGQDYVNFWECWAVHPSIESNYHYLRFSSLPGRVQILWHEPSVPVEGTILDADGKPVPDAWVGGNGFHRGPWARTTSSGRFRLEGYSGRRISVEVPNAPERDDAVESPSFLAPPPGVPCTYRLPPKDGATRESVEHPVVILLRDATTHEGIEEGVPLEAVRVADGRTVLPGASSQEIDALPAGAWTILVGGGASPWSAARVHLQVPEDRGAPPVEVVIEVTRNPALRVEFAGDPATSDVELVTASDTRRITEEELRGRSIRVPADGECAFRVGYPGAADPKVEHWLYTPLSVEARRPGAVPVRIASPAAVTIVASLAGPDGRSVPGWLSSDLAGLVEACEFADWEPTAPARLFPEVSVHAEGSIDLLVIPEARSLAPRIVTVALPPRSIEGGRVDAGSVRLGPRGDTSLRVLAADGSPLEYWELRVVRGGVVREWHRPEDALVFDPLLVPLAAGDVVEITGAWWGRRYVAPVRKRLEGAGPWTIRNELPDTSIVVDPTDESGKPLDAMLVIDGRPFKTEAYTDDDGKRHPFEIAGLDPGPHRVALSAKDHVTRVLRVVLAAGEHRSIPGRLRARPRPPAPRPR